MIHRHHFTTADSISYPSEVTSIRARQAHTNHMTYVDDSTSHPPTADALVTTQTGLALTITTADCLPILISDEVNGVIAAIHAGWRGIKDEIIQNTLNLMYEYGAQPNNIHVQIGPSIHSCCYEIFEKRRDAFAEKFLEHLTDIFRDEEPDTYLDLTTCARIQLTHCGVPHDQIQISPICTCCDPSDLPSFYRTGRTTPSITSSIWMT